jgi:ATP-binding cassette subfamily B protein
LWFVAFAITSFFFARYKVKFDEEKSAAESKTTANLSDVVANILNVKVFSAIANEFNNYKTFTKDEEGKRLKTWNLSIKQGMILNSTMVVLRMVAFWFVIHLWAKGEVTIGFVVLIQMYSSQLFEMVWQFNFAVRNFGRSVTDAKEMVEIFETPIDILDPVKPEKCKIKNGNISFDNVSFEYKDGKDVFNKLKLEIPAGQKVGFVGHSGSGKTTITNLLLRFEDVQSGAIKIDGQDIRNITQDDLRRNISYVPQEPALFHRTLRENIMYGNPNASKLAMLEASKKAHADEFIKEFKDGYETLVGERGVKLSGGQRQRVAIARVMLKDAPILILDEATSSLDSISENFIQKAFDEVMKGRTTIVIAHRLSTVQKMDRIIVLDKGKIVEDGGHAELLAKGGYYSRLWQAQKDGVI